MNHGKEYSGTYFHWLGINPILGHFLFYFVIHLTTIFLIHFYFLFYFSFSSYFYHFRWDETKKIWWLMRIQKLHPWTLIPQPCCKVQAH